ncbi:urease subunit beta [Paenibacillus koleovorans]|uniref:urease subunit beta n=1 Tax=Paenibacillus koleovorans TaxID=121608 RepID=UPI000FD9707A|nr:urease subunit beta [Paenibacillus koleovorans]
MIPGEYRLRDGLVELNAGRRTSRIEVANWGDRPVQVGSHFHFFEVNRELHFRREAAFGMRLDIPAGSAVRFEPGESKPVDLVEIGGAKAVYGMNGLTQGPTERVGNESAGEANTGALPEDVRLRLQAWTSLPEGGRQP